MHRPGTTEFYVVGTKYIDNNVLQEIIRLRKEGKLINILNRFKTNSVRFGLGKLIISDYIENT